MEWFPSQMSEHLSSTISTNMLNITMDDIFNRSRTSKISLSEENEISTVDSGISPLMSYTTMKTIEDVLLIGTLPVLVLCGVSLNVINIAVFIRQGFKDRINRCLFSLAVCDTGYMSVMFASRAHGIIHLIDSDLGQYWKVQKVILVGLYTGFSNTACCLTLLISLERCVCVVWPLKAKTILSDRKITLLIFLAVLLCFSCSLVFTFNYQVQSYPDPVTNVTRYRVQPTPFYIRNKPILDFIFENANILISTTSLIVVMANTIIISVRMRAALTWRKKTVGVTKPSSKDRREVSMTRMLVVVCIIFTVCTLPQVLRSFIRFTVPQFRTEGHYRNTYQVILSVMHTIQCVNSSVNFIVYYTMSTRFRETLDAMLKREVKS